MFETCIIIVLNTKQSRFYRKAVILKFYRISSFIGLTPGFHFCPFLFSFLADLEKVLCLFVVLRQLWHQQSWSRQLHPPKPGLKKTLEKVFQDRVEVTTFLTSKKKKDYFGKNANRVSLLVRTLSLSEKLFLTFPVHKKCFSEVSVEVVFPAFLSPLSQT